MTPGSWPLASNRWSQSWVVIGGWIGSARRAGPPGLSRRLAWLLGWGRAQPCPMARPCSSVIVTHDVVLGVAGGGGRQIPAEPRVDRADAGDLPGPVGQIQQGDQRDGQVDPPGEPRGHRARHWSRGGRPRRVCRLRAAPSATPWILPPAAVLLVGVLGRPGVLAQQQVQVGAGPQHVHVAVQAGLFQLPRPRGDPLVGSQHLGRRHSRPIRAAFPDSSAHRCTRASRVAASRRFLALSGLTSWPAAWPASMARSGQPGIRSRASPVPNAAARLLDSPGKLRAGPGCPGPRRPPSAANVIKEVGPRRSAAVTRSWPSCGSGSSHLARRAPRRTGSCRAA